MRKEFFNKKYDILGLRMVNCGYEDCCPGFLCAPHTRNYYLIHYIVKGEGYYEVENKQYPVCAGQLFIIYPDEIVKYYSPEIEKTWSFCWMGIDGKLARTYLEQAGFRHEKYLYHLGNESFLSHVMKCLAYIEHCHDNPSQLKLNAYLLACLSDIELKKDEKSTQKLKPVGQVDKAVTYIEYNYMNAITTSDVAKYLSLERSYFYRIFKKYTGKSPEQYIMNYRIKKSLDLISLGRYTFTEISLSVGIGDVYYFSKLFKRVMGCTPSQYRKSVQNIL